MNLHILALIQIICYKLNIWVLRHAVNRERSLAKMKIKWQKKNSAWSRYGSRRKQTTINQSLVSSSAQAQLHQAPVNGLENDLFYQVTCTYNIRLLNGCAAWVREMREQGMMGRRERTPSANPLYPIHPGHVWLHTVFPFERPPRCRASFSRLIHDRTITNLRIVLNTPKIPT